MNLHSDAPGVLVERIRRGEDYIAQHRAQGLPTDRSEAFLAELKCQLAALQGQDLDHIAGTDCHCGWWERAVTEEELEAEARKHGIDPCLFQVEWPGIHNDPQFRDDVIYFALDEEWVKQAPPEAVVYTAAELDAIKGLDMATLRLVHAAKRVGRVILETDGRISRHVFRVMREAGLTPMGADNDQEG